MKIIFDYNIRFLFSKIISKYVLYIIKISNDMKCFLVNYIKKAIYIFKYNVRALFSLEWRN